MILWLLLSSCAMPQETSLSSIRTAYRPNVPALPVETLSKIEVQNSSEMKNFIAALQSAQRLRV